jgi:hypothetical protein
MAAAQKLITTPDAATLDLWRAAEGGDVNELASVLPRVRDINARNEHGVTALMRAAQQGHVKMVRALLQHGADANIQRNDKFTALALAAFFGHTEIVRALMEHGADSQTATRHDTSPQMWATARTFNEVVDQLEKPARVEKLRPPRTPKQVATPPAATPPAPIVSSGSTDPVVRAVLKTAVVRTLKDPPEIWDLVHEAPRGFNPRSAFLTRLKTSKTNWAFRLAALVVLIGAGAVGVIVLRGAQARNEESFAPQPVQQLPAAFNTVNVTSENTTAPAAATTEPNAPPASNGTTPANDAVSPNASVVTRRPGERWSRATPKRPEREAEPQAAASEPVQPVTAQPAKVSAEPRSQAPAKPRASSPLSPQLIAPAKEAAPKGKVIQWP